MERPEMQPWPWVIDIYAWRTSQPWVLISFYLLFCVLIRRESFEGFWFDISYPISVSSDVSTVARCHSSSSLQSPLNTILAKRNYLHPTFNQLDCWNPTSRIIWQEWSLVNQHQFIKLASQTLRPYCGHLDSSANLSRHGLLSSISAAMSDQKPPPPPRPPPRDTCKSAICPSNSNIGWLNKPMVGSVKPCALWDELYWGNCLITCVCVLYFCIVCSGMSYENSGLFLRLRILGTVHLGLV
jgi:hypothetical protein